MDARDGGGADSLASAVRACRQAAGWTQRRLAEEAGVSIRLVQNVEQGVCTRPRGGPLRRLVEALGVNLAELAPASAPADGVTPRREQAALRVEVLGPLWVGCGGWAAELRGDRSRAVLGMLALHAGHVVSLPALTEALWAGEPPPTAHAMVQAHVSKLRGALTSQAGDRTWQCAVETVGNGYRLSLTVASLDLADFRHDAQRAYRALRDGDVADAFQAAEAALALWRGEPLADVVLLRDHPAVTGLAEEHARLVVAHAEAAVALGRCDQVLPGLLSLTQRFPLDERAHAALMLTLAGTGRQAAALEVFERVRHRLDEQLGVLPGPVLSDAHARVLRQETSAGTPPVARAHPKAPAGRPASKRPARRAWGAMPSRASCRRPWRTSRGAPANWRGCVPG